MDKIPDKPNACKSCDTILALHLCYAVCSLRISTGVLNYSATQQKMYNIGPTVMLPLTNGTKYIFSRKLNLVKFIEKNCDFLLKTHSK